MLGGSVWFRLAGPGCSRLGWSRLLSGSKFLLCDFVCEFSRRVASGWWMEDGHVLLVDLK